uniref:Uncharacterized protein n=1 Tax=Schistosoma haematobium TaxID=6185 RepID=A0A094ZXL9_SCHHA
MKVTPIIFTVFCIVGATTLIKATTLEHVPHPSEKDMELVYIDEEYQKEGGLVLILIS